MGYAKRKLKPVGHRSYCGVLIVILTLIIVGIVTVIWHHGAGIDDRGRDYGEKEERVNEQKEHLLGRDSQNRASYNKFRLGDYSNLQDADFRCRHGVDIDEVTKSYNPKRCNQVFRYCVRDKVEDSDKFFMNIYYSDECENQVVTQRFSDWWVPKNRKGILNIMEDLWEKIDWLASQAHEGVEIVSSSSNIHYRGHNKEDVKNDLCAAVMEVLGTGSNVAMVQWKTPKCYVEWRFVRGLLEGKTIYMTGITYSDQPILNEDNGQESPL